MADRSTRALPSLERLERLLRLEKRGLILEIGLFARDDLVHVELVGIHRARELIPVEQSGHEARRRDRVRSNDRRAGRVAGDVEENTAAPPRGTLIAAEERRLAPHG